MNRRNVILWLAGLVVIALVVALVVRLTSGPPANRLLVAGDVRPVVQRVVAPAIAYPSIPFNVKVSSNAAPGKAIQSVVGTYTSGGQPSLVTSPGISLPRPPQTLGMPPFGQSQSQGQPVLSGTLSVVNVKVGDHVTTGTVLVRMDTKLLDIGVQAAKIQAASAKTTVRVINNGINTILDNIDKISTGKAALATGKEQLVKAKATLLKAQAGLAQAKAARIKYEKMLAQAEAAAAKFPPGQVPPALMGEIAGLKIALTKIPTLQTIAAGSKKINAGLAQVAAGEAKLATGAAQLATAAQQLATASDALHTAKTQAYKARAVTGIIAGGANAGIYLAEAKRDATIIVSPVSGYVTQAPTKGSVAVVGSPLVVITPDAPALVDTYLSPQQLASVHEGSAADITFDSSGGRVVHGTLQTIGSIAQYPPTNFPTDLVHLTRTIKVTFRLDSGTPPPAGTPVDIAIHTN